MAAGAGARAAVAGASGAPRPLRRDPTTAYRGALLVLCALLTVVTAARTYATLPLALLSVLALAAARSRRARSRPLLVCVAEAVVAGGGAVLTGGAESPLLPYLLGPPVVAALLVDLRAAVVASGAGAAAVLLVAAVAGPDPLEVGDPSGGALAKTSATWVVLGLSLALLASRASAPAPVAAEEPEQRYAEAHALLEQLRRVGRRLPGGLDVGSTAEALLDEVGHGAPSYRAAVLVQPAGGSLVPVAVRGTRRVPWRDPLAEPGPLRTAWETRQPVVDRRAPDSRGRRRGSVLVVLPLVAGGDPFGLVVLESFDLDAYGGDDVRRAQERLRPVALRLETAVLFAEVRGAVTVEERDRLAREIHDGIAQDLAFVGYRLDDLRMQAARVDGHLAEEVSDVRKGLTSLISELRLSITDLRTSIASDRGLGQALSSYVRAMGSGQRLRVHLTLQESAFRLPAEQEVLLFKVAQEVAQDTRRGGRAANLWVDLVVEPPYGRLVVEHDGAEDGTGDLAPHAERLRALGGSIEVTPREGPGVRVTAVVEAEG